MWKGLSIFSCSVSWVRPRVCFNVFSRMLRETACIWSLCLFTYSGKTDPRKIGSEPSLSSWLHKGVARVDLDGCLHMEWLVLQEKVHWTWGICHFYSKWKQACYLSLGRWHLTFHGCKPDPEKWLQWRVVRALHSWCAQQENTGRLKADSGFCFSPHILTDVWRELSFDKWFYK